MKISFLHLSSDGNSIYVHNRTIDWNPKDTRLIEGLWVQAGGYPDKQGVVKTIKYAEIAVNSVRNIQIITSILVYTTDCHCNQLKQNKNVDADLSLNKLIQDKPTTEVDFYHFKEFKGHDGRTYWRYRLHAHNCIITSYAITIFE